MYEKECKTCGFMLSQFYKTGYLGCPDCYKYFKAEITPTIQKIQGSIYYSGKRPTLSFEDRELLNEYNAYILEKDKAGLERRFGDMEKINRILVDLSQELKRRGLI